MKVLFWMPPWAAQGDPVFYRNCFKKHLAPQANILASNGWSIDFVLPEFLSSERGLLSQTITLINLSISDQIAIFGSVLDPSVELYLNGKDKSYDIEVAHLSTILARSYDIILLWETPVPFLEIMYPNALIIHQMPGAFSRAPYPHTVTFDPIGLYKHGSLYLHANDIPKNETNCISDEIARNFIYRVRDSINSLQPFSRSQLNYKNKFNHLVLLPLQVSSHYAFQADTKYSNQMDFLLDVLSKVPLQTGVVVTQYVSPRVSDTVINKEILSVLKNSYPNLVYREEFDRISSVSQYLLPLVDEVITCSSSIGLQAFSWPRKLTVLEDTFLHRLATPTVSAEKDDEYERSLRILSFLINHNQPLFSSVVTDRKFLSTLLLEMLARKRSGKKGLELMPAFSEIDPEYSEKILGSFSIERAERDLTKSTDRLSTYQAEIGKFRRAVLNSEISTVTFDVFDTLIKRPTELPADVYKFLEGRALNITNGVAEDFARVRLNTEVETRKLSTKGEITLREIYTKIQDFYALPEQITENLLQAEIEMELRFIQPRPFGKKCWEIALASGKPIYLISDMYLSYEVIEQMLQKVGYGGYKKIFLSSEYLLRKKEGGLFDAVLQEIKISPSKVLHVGDNKIADVEQANARGIKTFRMLRAVDRMRGNNHYKFIYPPKSGVGERARSAISGLIAQTLFDSPAGQHEKNSHFHGNPQYLGYAGLGPLLTAYMLWLGRQAKRDGISRLFFLSREGWILKQVYDTLHISDKSAVPSAYMYASRRATRVSSLRSEGDVLALSGQPFRAGIAVGELLNSRFGLVESDLITLILQEFGYFNWTSKLESDSASRMKFSELCSRLANHILDVAKNERECYLDYLARIGFAHSEKPGVVDIGWRGNIQGALANLIGQPIHGYYYATLQGAEVWKSKGNKMWAFMGDLVSSNHPSVVVANRHLIEYLTCHVESSLIRIEKSGNDLIPIFRSEENYGMRRQLIEEVHQGCIRFAHDFEREFGYLFGQIWIDPFLGEGVIASFINSPSKIDAELLLGHHFEDALGGVSRQYIIHPQSRRAARDSVWKMGAYAIHGDGIDDLGSLNHSQGKTITPNSVVNKDPNLTMLRQCEDVLIKVFTSDKKYQKYKRNRQTFFDDSRSRFLKIWAMWIS